MKTCFVLLCGLSVAYTASGTNLFTNGGFETGDLSGWTMTTAPVTTGYPLGFFAASGTITPLNGYPTVGPNSGTFYAVSDSEGPGTSALFQSFTVPLGTTSAILSFDIFVNDVFGGSGPGGSVVLLAAGADPLSAAPLATLYGPSDTGLNNGNPNPWVVFTSANLIGAGLVAGTTYEIAVLESDNASPINVGVDNFSLDATGSLATPEPAMFFPVALTAGFLLFRSRRKAQARP
jgi:hypothetical protein